MSEWFEGDVIANGIRLHYHRTDGDKPALVVVHGITDMGISSRQYGRFWPRFERDSGRRFRCHLYIPVAG